MLPTHQIRKATLASCLASLVSHGNVGKPQLHRSVGARTIHSAEGTSAQMQITQRSVFFTASQRHRKRVLPAEKLRVAHSLNKHFTSTESLQADKVMLESYRSDALDVTPYGGNSVASS